MGVDKNSPRLWHITVAGVSGLFDKKSGVETSSTARRYRDGGAANADILMDPQEHGDLTVSRAFSLARDFKVIKILRPRVGLWETRIVAQPLYGSGAKAGSTLTYTGKLRSLTDPESDSNGGADPTTFSLVFAVSRIV